VYVGGGSGGQPTLRKRSVAGEIANPKSRLTVVLCFSILLHCIVE
jgi:hypothetical protein